MACIVFRCLVNSVNVNKYCYIPLNWIPRNWNELIINQGPVQCDTTLARMSAEKADTALKTLGGWEERTRSAINDRRGVKWEKAGVTFHMSPANYLKAAQGGCMWICFRGITRARYIPAPTSIYIDIRGYVLSNSVPGSVIWMQGKSISCVFITTSCVDLDLDQVISAQEMCTSQMIECKIMYIVLALSMIICSRTGRVVIWIFPFLLYQEQSKRTAGKICRFYSPSQERIQPFSSQEGRQEPFTGRTFLPGQKNRRW